MSKFMRIIAMIMAVVMMTAAFAGCGETAENGGENTVEPVDVVVPAKTGDPAESDLYVGKVEGLSEDFMMGADVSSVIALENAGVTYEDWDGNEKDLFVILAEAGINTIRVRIWNDPYDANGNGYGGGNCDLDKAIEIGKRAAAVGMGLLVDFHYSDFWADPAKQQAPKAWAAMSVHERTDAIYEYTKESLQALKDAGAIITAVQIGNETTSGMAGVTNSWTRVCKFFNAGSQAVREVAPEAKVVLHFTNPNRGILPEKADSLNANGVDYDVFATSYYPEYHGTIDNMVTQLVYIQETYGKEVMIAETSWGYTMEDGDGHGNNFSGNGSGGYMVTQQGQANLIEDLVRAMNDIGGLGVFYWEPAWVPVNSTFGLQGADWEARYALNKASWEKDGTGWASSFAAEYDPEDAGQWYGGCACDNLALFDSNGKALESLKTFSYVYTGTTAEPSVQNINNIVMVVQKNTEFVAPETATALMTDMSTFEAPVTWNADELAKVDVSVVNNYIVNGETEDGTAVVLEVQVKTLNILESPSFEDNNSVWTVTSDASEQLFDTETPKSGDKCFHYYDVGESDFTIEQTVTVPTTGIYRLSANLQGGEAGKAKEAYIFIKIDGKIVAQADFENPMAGWKQWSTAVLGGVELTEGQVVTVGAYVSFGSGGWGTMDDFEFCME